MEDAKAAALKMAKTDVDRAMIGAALALFLDKLRDTHVVMTHAKLEDLLFEKGQERYWEGHSDGAQEKA